MAERAAMARPFNVAHLRDAPATDLFRFFEQANETESSAIRDFFIEHLRDHGAGGWLVCGLLDYYINGGTLRSLDILLSCNDANAKHLIDRLYDMLSSSQWRRVGLAIGGHCVRGGALWLRDLVARASLIKLVCHIVQSDPDLECRVGGVLLLSLLVPMFPQALVVHIKHLLDTLGCSLQYLSSLHVQCMKSLSSAATASSAIDSGHHVCAPVTATLAPSLYSQLPAPYRHLYWAVYTLLSRLYALYPCSSLSYLRNQYAIGAGRDAGGAHVPLRPSLILNMLQQLRLSPLLVFGSSEAEFDQRRWRHLETHDIVHECVAHAISCHCPNCHCHQCQRPDDDEGAQLDKSRACTVATPASVVACSANFSLSSPAVGTHLVLTSPADCLTTPLVPPSQCDGGGGHSTLDRASDTRTSVLFTSDISKSQSTSVPSSPRKRFTNFRFMAQDSSQSRVLSNLLTDTVEDRSSNHTGEVLRRSGERQSRGEAGGPSRRRMTADSALHSMIARLSRDCHSATKSDASATQADAKKHHLIHVSSAGSIAAATAAAVATRTADHSAVTASTQVLSEPAATASAKTPSCPLNACEPSAINGTAATTTASSSSRRLMVGSGASSECVSRPIAIPRSDQSVLCRAGAAAGGGGGEEGAALVALPGGGGGNSFSGADMSSSPSIELATSAGATIRAALSQMPPPLAPSQPLHGPSAARLADAASGAGEARATGSVSHLQWPADVATSAAPALLVAAPCSWPADDDAAADSGHGDAAVADLVGESAWPDLVLLSPPPPAASAAAVTPASSLDAAVDTDVPAAVSAECCTGAFDDFLSSSASSPPPHLSRSMPATAALESVLPSGSDAQTNGDGGDVEGDGTLHCDSQTWSGRHRHCHPRRAADGAADCLVGELRCRPRGVGDAMSSVDAQSLTRRRSCPELCPAATLAASGVNNGQSVRGAAAAAVGAAADAAVESATAAAADAASMVLCFDVACQTSDHLLPPYHQMIGALQTQHECMCRHLSSVALATEASSSSQSGALRTPAPAALSIDYCQSHLNNLLLHERYKRDVYVRRCRRLFDRVRQMHRLEHDNRHLTDQMSALSVELAECQRQLQLTCQRHARLQRDHSCAISRLQSASDSTSSAHHQVSRQLHQQQTLCNQLQQQLASADQQLQLVRSQLLERELSCQDTQQLRANYERLRLTCDNQERQLLMVLSDLSHTGSGGGGDQSGQSEQPGSPGGAPTVEQQSASTLAADSSALHSSTGSGCHVSQAAPLAAAASDSGDHVVTLLRQKLRYRDHLLQQQQQQLDEQKSTIEHIRTLSAGKSKMMEQRYLMLKQQFCSLERQMLHMQGMTDGGGGGETHGRHGNGAEPVATSTIEGQLPVVAPPLENGTGSGGVAGHVRAVMTAADVTFDPRSLTETGQL